MATVASYLRPTVSWQGPCTFLRKNPLPQSLPPPPPPPRIIVCFTSVRLLVSSSSSYGWYLEVCDKEIVERQWWDGRQQLRWGRQSGGRKKNMRVWSGNGSSEDAGGGGGGGGDALGVEERVGAKEVLGFDISRLEAYSERAPSEVLRVHAMVDDEEDQVIIFKGFSSSLTRATAYDPADPVLPSTATVQSIDRIRGPYNPSKLRFIKKGLSWEEFQEILKEQGI